MRKDAWATRSALLSAGIQVFSEQGYEKANVRDICNLAGVNVGAINRHFGGKQKFYETLIVEIGQSLAIQVPCPRLEDYESPDEALKAWLSFYMELTLVRRIEDPAAGSLILNEIRNPTSALEKFVQLMIKPMRNELARIVGAVLGKRNTRRRRESAANFAYAICVFHAFGEPVLNHLGHPPPKTKAEVSKLVRLVFPFVMGGIKGL